MHKPPMNAYVKPLMCCSGLLPSTPHRCSASRPLCSSLRRKSPSVPYNAGLAVPKILDHVRAAKPSLCICERPELMLDAAERARALLRPEIVQQLSKPSFPSADWRDISDDAVNGRSVEHEVVPTGGQLVQRVRHRSAPPSTSDRSAASANGASAPRALICISRCTLSGAAKVSASRALLRPR